MRSSPIALRQYSQRSLRFNHPNTRTSSLSTVQLAIPTCLPCSMTISGTSRTPASSLCSAGLSRWVERLVSTEASFYLTLILFPFHIYSPTTIAPQVLYRSDERANSFHPRAPLRPVCVRDIPVRRKSDQRRRNAIQPGAAAQCALLAFLVQFILCNSASFC